MGKTENINKRKEKRSQLGRFSLGPAQLHSRPAHRHRAQNSLARGAHCPVFGHARVMAISPDDRWGRLVSFSFHLVTEISRAARDGRAWDLGVLPPLSTN
jgi:hypothetical protein